MGSGTGMTMRLALAALAFAVTAAAAACGGDTSSASITADGSSTVGPFMEVASGRFQAESDVEIDVSISESGHGLDRFCAGDVDIANASRPIDEDEAATCAEAGV